MRFDENDRGKSLLLLCSILLRLPKRISFLEGRIDLFARNLDCERLFRFSASQIISLADLLELPRVITTRSRLTAMGWEGLAIFLNRWSSPCRYVDIQERFRRSEKELSEIGLYVLKFLYLRFGKHLQKPCFEILRNRASEYAEGVIRKGSPLRNCIGFIDGTLRTLRSICRPMLFWSKVKFFL